MSTELKSIKGRKETEFGYNESEIKLTRFSGGKNGRMVQININPDVDRNGIFRTHTTNPRTSKGTHNRIR